MRGKAAKEARRVARSWIAQPRGENESRADFRRRLKDTKYEMIQQTGTGRNGKPCAVKIAKNELTGKPHYTVVRKETRDPKTHRRVRSVQVTEMPVILSAGHQIEHRQDSIRGVYNKVKASFKWAARHPVQALDRARTMGLL